MTAALAPWWRPLAMRGAVTVLHVDLAPDEARESAALAALDEDERARWRAFEYSGPRRQFALCRAALRAVLSERLGCGNRELAFGTSEHGKPFAVVRGRPAPISFNVSHGGGHGLIAVSPAGRLGVDVEERVPHKRFDLLAAATFAEAERAEYEAARGAERSRLFFRLWTIKEALLKAHGDGFLLDATAFEVPRGMRAGQAGGAVRLPWEPGVVWRLEDLGDERFAAALAHEAPREPDTGGAR